MNTEPTALSCPYCGTQIPPGNRFCGICGQPVARSVDSQALLPQQPVYMPAAAPLPVQTPPTPNFKRGWKIWLIGAIVIAVVGAIAAVAIPAYIVSHPGSVTSRVTSSTHLTHCGVGTDYDSNTGTIQGENTNFSLSDPNLPVARGGLTLACFVATNANIHDVTDQLTGPSEPDLPPSNAHADIDALHGVYYEYGPSFVNLSPGSYSWKVFYAGVQELSIDFQVTS